MDKKKSFLNVFISILFKIILLITAILTKRFLIRYIGNEANGLNSLYISLIGMLSIAELGVGSAITFSMYKPITQGDNAKVSALYGLFTKFYLIVGIIITVSGIIIMPFLPLLTKDYTLDINIYTTYLLMLLSVVISYLFSSKISLINAYKDNYITTTISSVGMLLQQILQIISLILFQSFEIYLICRIISILVQWMTTEIYTRKKYSNIIFLKASVDGETKKQIIKNSKAMMMHKIGSLLVNTVDSIIISAFVGIAVLGKYSNYTTIIVSLASILTLFFTPLTSVIGHLCVKNNIEEEKKYFKFFFTFNFVAGTIFYLGYYAVIDDVVRICFGDNLEMEKSAVFVITLNYFIQYMRQSVLLFRDATGTFYNDRWKPLFEGMSNLILSIILVRFIGITGVIIATIVTNIFICHIVEPYVLYKNVFKESPKKYYLKNYLYIGVFVLLMFAMTYLIRDIDNMYKSLFVNGIISIGLSIIPCVIILIINNEFRNKCFDLMKPILNKFLKSNQKNS